MRFQNHKQNLRPTLPPAGISCVLHEKKTLQIIKTSPFSLLPSFKPKNK